MTRRKYNDISQPLYTITGKSLAGGMQQNGSGLYGLQSIVDIIIQRSLWCKHRPVEQKLIKECNYSRDFD